MESTADEFTILLNNTINADDNRSLDANEEMVEFLQNKIHSMKMEDFMILQNEIFRILYDYLNSPDMINKMKGLTTINIMLPILANDDQFLQKSANLLRSILIQDNLDKNVTEYSIRVFALLAQLGGPIDYISQIIKRGIDKLVSINSKSKIYDSLLTIELLSKTNPNLFSIKYIQTILIEIDKYIISKHVNIIAKIVTARNKAVCKRLLEVNMYFS